MRDRRPCPPTRLLGLIALAWLAPIASAADAPAPGPALHLADGGFAAGSLEDSTKPGTIRWRSPVFAAPLEFPLDRVASVTFPVPAGTHKPVGESCFELAGGDVLFGTLAGLDADAATIETARFGRLRIARTKLLRISRWRDGSDAIYLGPNGLAGWRVPEKAATAKGAPVAPAARRVVGQPLPETPAPTIAAWREEGGQIATNVEGASLRSEFQLPDRSMVEFEISWTDKPDFVLALGSGDDDESFRYAFRFEVWGDDLVAFREGLKDADVAGLQHVGSGAGRVQLQAYVEPAGRMIVTSPSGKVLADLRVPSLVPLRWPYIRLANRKGNVRLESLRVGRWDGEAPRDARADQARIHRGDGTITYGQILRYDNASKEFLVRGEGDKETRAAADKVTSVVLAAQGDEGPRGVRASFADGSRLSGELAKVEKGTMFVDVPGVEGAIRLPLDGLRSLASPRQAAPEGKPEWIPRIEAEGVRLRGALADGREAGDSSCLAWKPAGAEAAVALRHGVAARVLFKEPPLPPTPQQVALMRVQRQQLVMQRQQAQPGLGARIINALAGNPAPGQPTLPSASPTGGTPLAIHLRTGDVIPSEIKRIDEQGVSFKTPLSTTTFITHDKIKAVELARDEPPALRLNKSKRERLLTLPRMQKGSPPTHLIRSRNGDYLRGRVVAMDDKKLQVEVHLENKDLPRDRVGRIIWFHADELDDSKGPAKTPEPPGATRVQALRHDGIRLTFNADRLAEGAVSGKSDVLGACKVAVSEVDQLLVGGDIEKAAANVAYGPWRLHGAPEPQIPEPDGSSSGSESPLVGKPAPDFTLPLLDGKPFHLAEAKGKVVLLDFWATWCGPCLQAMPQVEAVAEEFKDKGVVLVAVNLQEEPKQISAMLERHKMHPTVVLDRDGAVAQKYEANAIPQTVIIDKEGKVAKLFVGGGPRLGDQLREALKAVLEGKAE